MIALTLILFALTVVLMSVLAYLAIEVTYRRISNDRRYKASKKADEAWWVQHNARKALHAQRATERVLTH